MYEELQKHNVPSLEQSQYDSDDDNEPPTLDWRPAPSLHYQRTSGCPVRTIDNGKDSGLTDNEVDNNNSASNKNDLLPMLVGIYGSKDLFVEEYRAMLADKLLTNHNNADGNGLNTDLEFQNLELLKIRFGESSMRQCEIMVKDMDDSKRINSNISSTLNAKKDIRAQKATVIDASIISHVFWPALQQDSVKHHSRIRSLLDEFSVEYAKLKNPRRLVWFGQLGQVQLELEVVEENNGDREEEMRTTKDFTCSPLQATLISLFEDRERWTEYDLSIEIGLPEDIIKKKMVYWLNHHIVRIVPDSRGTNNAANSSRIPGVNINNKQVYELVSSKDTISLDAEEHDMMGFEYDHNEDEGNALGMSSGTQAVEDLKMYTSYITGMLSNLGPMPLERIHNMLKVIVASGSEHKYNKTPQQLTSLLQQLCREEKVESCADGRYEVIKK